MIEVSDEGIKNTEPAETISMDKTTQTQRASKAIDWKKREKAEREESIHKVVFLCQKMEIPRERAIKIVQEKCMIGLREARLGVERYWQIDNV
jgi:hypothetical protein